MATFKISDVTISLDPGWCGATKDHPPGKPVFCPEPTCPISDAQIIEPTCPVSDVGAIQGAAAGELSDLKKQLQALLSQVARREDELQREKSGDPTEPSHPAELKALGAKLSQALGEVQKKIRETRPPAKAAKKTKGRAKVAKRSKS
jgi:hypothetical protein